MTLTIATWNVNSIRARLPHVLRFLEEKRPDVLLLQETKTTDADFPHTPIQDAGYETAHYGQRTYNGVAIVSRLPLSEVLAGMPQRAADPQSRVIAATVINGGKPLRVVSVYVPNGQSVESEKYQYKLSWLEDFADYLLATRRRYGAVIAGGDYNIAPADSDIYDAEKWGEDVLASPRERAAFRNLCNTGYEDAHHLFKPPENVFTWWDYRRAAFARNHGLRIDLFLLSPDATKRCTACAPDTAPRSWERPSDHTPVCAAFN